MQEVENKKTLAQMSGQIEAQAKKQDSKKNINELDNDAFMKLFLEQLKNQDPTAPMETDKIITQTAQLTQVEMMEQNKKTMVEVTEAMKGIAQTNDGLKAFQEKFKDTLDGLNTGIASSIESNKTLSQSSAFNTVAMIGKIAETDVFGVNLSKEGEIPFSLYFDEPIDSKKGIGSISILDKDNNLVNSISVENKDGKSGYLDFVWDGKDKSGKQMPTGTYSIKANYNVDKETRIGRGEVQSVIFDKGTPKLRLGSMILPMESALEFYAREAK